MTGPAPGVSGQGDAERPLLGPLLALGLAVFAGTASMRCLDALLPVLAERFGRSLGSTGGAVSAYALSYSLFQLLYGPLGDRFGTYRVVSWAACLSAVAAGACIFATTLSQLVAFRFAAGAIAAAVGPLTLAWVSRATPPGRRSLALARMTAAAILGTAAGQVGGGVIGGTFGAPAVFGGLAALFGVSGGMLILIGRRRPEVLDCGEQGGRAAERGLPLLSLVRRPAVKTVLIAVGVECFALYFSLTYTGGLLRQRLAMGPPQAGLIIALYGLGGIGFVLSAGLILPRLGPGARAGAGGVMLSLGFVALGLSQSALAAATSLFAIGYGFLMLHNVLQVMATQMAPDALATSLSLFAAFASLSQALGAGAGGYVFDRIGPLGGCLISAAMLAGLGLALARASPPRPVTPAG